MCTGLLGVDKLALYSFLDEYSSNAKNWKNLTWWSWFFVNNNASDTVSVDAHIHVGVDTHDDNDNIEGIDEEDINHL